MTTFTTRTLATGLASAALALAAFAPTATAMPELSGPAPSQQQAPAQDHRSPDARDAATRSARQSVPAQDHRSPDTRDVANGYAPTYVPEPTTVGVPSDGFDWVSGAIGAAAIGGLILVLLAGIGTRRRFRHAPRPLGA